MIQINLLPGDGKKKRRANSTKGLKFELRPADWFAGIACKMRYADASVMAAPKPTICWYFLLSSTSIVGIAGAAAAVSGTSARSNS